MTITGKPILLPLESFFVEVAQYDTGRLLRRTASSPVREEQETFCQTLPLATPTGRWSCTLSYAPATADTPALPPGRTYDITARFLLREGFEAESDVALGVRFSDWSVDNYVLLPAAIYAGNRFESREGEYPPLLEHADDLGPDCPTIISDVPRLATDLGAVSRFQQMTRDLATPMVVLHLRESQTGILLQTPQEIAPWGDLLYDFTESDDRASARLRISAPGVRDRAYSRARRSTEDRGAHFAPGITGEITIPLRVYLFERCTDIPAVLERFMMIRQVHAPPPVLRAALPLSMAFDLVQAKTNRENWNGCFGFLGSGTQNGPFGFWQLGWVGGLLNTLPLLSDGSDESRRRVCRTLDFLLETQTATGLFWPIHDGETLVGDGFGKPHAARWLLTRRCGDALFFLIRHLETLQRQGHTLRPEWEQMARHHADALVRVWEANGQWGQFVDCETGEITVGNSTSAGIVPGALALASAYFDEASYRRVAEEGARFFYRQFVCRGFTTGGPGDALQCPDSESAFGLLESFVELAELTRVPEWTAMARDTAHLCATWCTSYDFRFPPQSLFGKLDMRTTGSVWANVQNKHGAPNICTLSGVSLLKLYRAVTAQGGNGLPYLTLLREIVHNQTQYVSRPDRPVGGMPPGYINERVNLSDWAEGIGEIFFGSCWPEAALMLSWVEVPGVYVQSDTGLVITLDNIEAEVVAGEPAVSLRLRNPTAFPARVRVFVETAADLHRPLGRGFLSRCPVIALPPGESRIVGLDR